MKNPLLVRYLFIGLLLTGLGLAVVQRSWAQQILAEPMAINAGHDPAPTFGSFNQHMAEIKEVYFASYADKGEAVIYRFDPKTNNAKILATGYKTVQPAAMLADKNNKLHLVFTQNDNGSQRCHYLRYVLVGTSLQKEVDIQYDSDTCSTKFSLAYNPNANKLFWSRRDFQGNVHLATLNANYTPLTSALQIATASNPLNQLSNKILVQSSGNQATGPYWDAHYHSLYYQPGVNRLNMIYNPHYWPTGDLSNYLRAKVLYMYSNDSGNTWKRSDGKKITIPFKADDCFIFTPGVVPPSYDSFCTKGGTDVSVNKANAWGASLMAVDKNVHIIYFTAWPNSNNPLLDHNDDPGTFYVRLQLGEESPDIVKKMDGFGPHVSLIKGKSSGTLYAFGEKDNIYHQLQKSTDTGKTWDPINQYSQTPYHDRYTYSTALPQVASENNIIGIFTDFMDNAALNPKTQECRFESSDAKCPVSLAVYQPYLAQNQPVTPVGIENIAQAKSNSQLIQLDAAQTQGVDLGNITVGQGLTLEGWFYPTGGAIINYAPLITKRTSWKPGNYWMRITSDNKLQFGIYEKDNIWWSWKSKAAVSWGEWNYLAVTWKRNSQNVDFYLKTIDGEVVHETVNNPNVGTVFPDTDDHVWIGFNSAWGAGFTGYVDEVRIADDKLHKNQLMVERGPSADNDAIFIRYSLP